MFWLTLLGGFFGNLFSAGDEVPFWILATDYHRYSIIYGCRDVREDGTCPKNQTNFLVMSRNQMMGEVDSRIRRMMNVYDKKLGSYHYCI
jgi:hypothetical protein